MKRIQMPSSYAVVTEEEKELLGGGGAFRDAWDSFTDFRKYRSSNRLALLQRITHSSNISSLLKNGTPHSRYFSDELGVLNFFVKI